MTYILLGIFVGAVGAHNVYAGQFRLGGLKFGLVLLGFMIDAAAHFYSAFFFFALAICALWALAEIIFVKTDGVGIRMS